MKFDKKKVKSFSDDIKLQGKTFTSVNIDDIKLEGKTFTSVNIDDIKLEGKTFGSYKIDEVPGVEIPDWAYWDLKKIYYPKPTHKF